MAVGRQLPNLVVDVDILKSCVLNCSMNCTSRDLCNIRIFQNKDELSTNIVEEQTISNQSHKEWLLVAKILDRLSFIGILLAYVIMFIAFMP